MVGYSVYLGVDQEGRKKRRFFKDLSDAETFQGTRIANPESVGQLLERKTELLYSLERLKSTRAFSNRRRTSVKGRGFDDF